MRQYPRAFNPAASNPVTPNPLPFIIVSRSRMIVSPILSHSVDQSAHSPQPIPETPSLHERLYLDILQPPQPMGHSVKPAIPGHDVILGLQANPRTLPPHYFYDDRGSQLFETICTLPEYYPTRTEAAILQQSARAIAQITGPCQLIELGSGSSTKTRFLLDAYAQTYPDHPLSYLPNDVSGGILKTSALDLLATYPTLHIRGLIGPYELALRSLPPSPLPARMICFLGSTLGNFTPQESDRLFAQIIQALQPGDYFLLGVDLQKPKQILEAAYNDSQGITAAFNLNILHHLNRRFEGNFPIEQFHHWAFYNETHQQIEMHLRSQQSPTIHLKKLNLTLSLSPGETIRTEISRKFNRHTLQHTLLTQNLHPRQTWTDPQQWFGLILCQLPPI